MEEYFYCLHCHKKVLEATFGTGHRNHCPFCLWSQHLDIKPGDRKSKCKGIMKPIGLTSKKDGELMIISQCQKCGEISKNRIAGDDDPKAIFDLLENSRKNAKILELKLSKESISLFTDEKAVTIQLLGKLH